MNNNGRHPIYPMRGAWGTEDKPDEDAQFRIGNYEFQFSGLTKREYFAAMALQGLCTTETLLNGYTIDKLSSRAVELADALLEKLSK